MKILDADGKDLYLVYPPTCCGGICVNCCAVRLICDQVWIVSYETCLNRIVLNMRFVFWYSCCNTGGKSLRKGMLQGLPPNLLSRRHQCGQRRSLPRSHYEAPQVCLDGNLYRCRGVGRGIPQGRDASPKGNFDRPCCLPQFHLLRGQR